MHLMSDGGAHALRFRKRPHLVGLCGRGAERMLAVDVLASLQCRHHDAVVGIGSHAHAHHVDLGPLAQHAIDAVVGVRQLEAARRGARAFHARRAGGDDFELIRKRFERRQVRADGEALPAIGAVADARPDDSDFELRVRAHAVSLSQRAMSMISTGSGSVSRRSTNSSMRSD